MSTALVSEWFKADQKSTFARLDKLPVAVQMFNEYINRVGFKEWPDYAKFPFVAADLNSCPKKGVTPIPLPALALNFWYLTQGDVTVPNKERPWSNLCHMYGLEKHFCPATQNALQKFIKKFDYSSEEPYFEFMDGKKVYSMSLIECEKQCSVRNYGNTAYIGSGEDSHYGMVLEHSILQKD